MNHFFELPNHYIPKNLYQYHVYNNLKSKKTYEDEMSNILDALDNDYKKFNVKIKALKEAKYIEYDKLQAIMAPIVNRYKIHIQDKLIPIIDLFEYFCSVVRNNADNMTKFVSQLTVEDFSKIISGGDENE